MYKLQDIYEVAMFYIRVWGLAVQINSSPGGRFYISVIGGAL